MDWNEPLGMTPPPRSRRRTGLIAGCAVAALLAGGLSLFLATADPHGGDPYVTVQIPPFAAKAIPVAGIDPAPTGSLAPLPPQSDIEGGVRVVRGRSDMAPQPASAASGPLVIDVARAVDEQDRKHRDPVFKSVTPSAPGAAPAAVPPAAAAPRVAVFVSGMGLSAAGTQTAAATMPAAVDLAFVPFGDATAAEVQAARAKGHEVLLQLPMESGTGQRLGPHSLRAGEPAADVQADVAWAADRFTGYAGVVNLLGGTVTADTSVMQAVLKSLSGKGLFYLDDGTSRRSLAASLGPAAGVPVLTADVVLDATSDPQIVKANLDRLVALARAKGKAIGMASGLPDHLATIARYADGLKDQGVMLVPVGALVPGQADIAAAR